MNRPYLVIPLVGCLVLAIAVSAPGVVADLVGARGGWRTAFEMVPEKPMCRGLPGFTHCRVEYRHTTATGTETDVLDTITISPLPQYVRLLRSDLVAGHVTTLTALDHLRERCAIVLGLLGLLGVFLWPLVVAVVRALVPTRDTDARLAAAGWRVTPDEPRPAPSRSAPQAARAFGRRH